jgi:hypothetical protein
MRAFLGGWWCPIQAATSREVDEVGHATENVGSFGVVQDRVERLIERIFAHVALANEG